MLIVLPELKHLCHEPGFYPAVKGSNPFLKVGNQANALLVNALKDKIQEIIILCLVNLIEYKGSGLLVNHASNHFVQVHCLLVLPQPVPKVLANLNHYLVGGVVMPAVNIYRENLVSLLF